MLLPFPDSLDFGAQLFQFLLEAVIASLQSLNGSKGDAVRIESVDGGVTFAEGEGGAEILRGRADVVNAGILCLVAPAMQRQRGNLVKNLIGIDGTIKILLANVAQTLPRSRRHWKVRHRQRWKFHCRSGLHPGIEW